MLNYLIALVILFQFLACMALCANCPHFHDKQPITCTVICPGKSSCSSLQTAPTLHKRIGPGSIAVCDSALQKSTWPGDQ